MVEREVTLGTDNAPIGREVAARTMIAMLKRVGGELAGKFV